LADFPQKFGFLVDSRAFLQQFYRWYNYQHRHSGIAYLTPATVHRSQASTALAARAQTLAEGFAAHPERFVRGAPRPASVPNAVWINPPKICDTAGGSEAALTAAPQESDPSVVCALPQATSIANSTEAEKYIKL
jgi:putative transposase